MKTKLRTARHSIVVKVSHTVATWLETTIRGYWIHLLQDFLPWFSCFRTLELRAASRVLWRTPLTASSTLTNWISNDSLSLSLSHCCCSSYLYTSKMTYGGRGVEGDINDGVDGLSIPSSGHKWSKICSWIIYVTKRRCVKGHKGQLNDSTTTEASNHVHCRHVSTWLWRSRRK